MMTRPGSSHGPGTIHEERSIASAETADDPAPEPAPRVLVVIPAICRAGGGVAEAARVLALGLARAGVRVSVVTKRTPHFAEDRAGWGDIEIRAYPPRGPAALGFAPGMFRDLARAEADLAHVHGLWMLHCLAALRWHRRTGRPYVVTPHGMLERWITRRSPWRKRIVSALFHDRFLSAAAGLHVLTPKEAGDVAETLGALPVTEVPNFLPDRPRASARPRWWAPSMAGRTVFLFLGRIHDKKGWRELCAAWAARSAADPAFRDGAFLVFCGWLDDVPDFAETVAGVGARFGNILHAGPQYGEDKFASYAAADFFILPSKSEGLPMAVLEAWQAGVPVLMTEACNLSPAFAAGAALRIGESVGEVEAGIATAFALPKRDRREMSRAGQAFLARFYGEKSTIARMIAFYREAGARRP